MVDLAATAGTEFDKTTSATTPATDSGTGRRDNTVIDGSSRRVRDGVSRIHSLVPMSTNRARDDDDLAGEQAHLAFAEICLETMRDRAEATLAQAERDAHLDTAFDHAAISSVLRQRLVALQHGRGALAFGRIDTDEGDVFRVGRRHVEDIDHNHVVVDWRATVSAPFYRATWVDPLGLTRRRRFAIDGTFIAG